MRSTDSTANSISGSPQLHGGTVMARDVHGGIHVHRAPVAPLPLTRQLPLVPAHFTDRTDRIKSLDLAVAGPSPVPVVAISGISGVGKTALAVFWLHRRRTEFPDGQVYADLHGPGAPVRPGDVLHGWLRAFGLTSPPAGLAELSALWRSVTASRRVAVLVDNAVDAAQVRPLLPGGTGSLTMVTSRRKIGDLAVDGAMLLELGPLNGHGAIELLARCAGAAQVPMDSTAAARIAAACEYLPLSLVLAGAQVASRPGRSLRHLADALDRRRPSPAHRYEFEEAALNAITAGLDESYEGLEPAAQRVYRRLAVLPTIDVDPDMVAAACVLSWNEAEWQLEVLSDEHLVEDLAPDGARHVRYRFGNPAREHALRLAESEDDATARHETLRRLCDWALTTATAAQRLLTPIQNTLPRTPDYPPDATPPFTEEAGALAWLSAQSQNLMAILRRAARTPGWDDLVWQLVDAMWPLFMRLHPYEMWIEAHEIGRAAARQAGNAEAERQMLNSGAIGLARAGRLDEAIAWNTTSRQMARAAGDTRDEGQTLLGLGGCHYEAGRPQQAEQYLQQAIGLWADCNYPRGSALALILLGEIARDAQEHERAVDLFTRAHLALQAASDEYDAARAQAFRGQVLDRSGAYDAGVRDLEAALEVFEETGGPGQWTARTLVMLGEAAQHHGDLASARLRYTAAAEQYALIRPAEADRLHALLETL